MFKKRLISVFLGITILLSILPVYANENKSEQEMRKYVDEAVSELEVKIGQINKDIPLPQKWYELLSSSEYFEIFRRAYNYDGDFWGSPEINLWDWGILLGEITGEEPRIYEETARKIFEENTFDYIISALKEAQPYPYALDTNFCLSSPGLDLYYRLNDDAFLRVRIPPSIKYETYKINEDGCIKTGGNLYTQLGYYNSEFFSLDDYYVIPSYNLYDDILEYNLYGGSVAFADIIYSNGESERLYPKAPTNIETQTTTPTITTTTGTDSTSAIITEITTPVKDNPVNFKYNTSDVIRLAKYISGRLSYDEAIAPTIEKYNTLVSIAPFADTDSDVQISINPPSFDLNEDGVINSDDLLYMIKILVGDITIENIRN